MELSGQRVWVAKRQEEGVGDVIDTHGPVSFCFFKLRWVWGGDRRFVRSLCTAVQQ